MTEILLIVLANWVVCGLMVGLGHLVSGPKEPQKSEPAEPKSDQPEVLTKG